jgi:ribonuclease D
MAERLPRTQEYHLTAEDMGFTVIVTARAARVEEWILSVKAYFLDAAPIKCVGLDCEFTSPLEGRQNQRAAVLQLSVATDTLVFQICRADAVPELLKEFLRDSSVRFCGAAIGNDLRMLRYYGLEVATAVDLQHVIPNPTTNPVPSLYALANATIGTNLQKKKKRSKDDELIFGWSNVPLSFEQIKYAALDARLGFEIARRHWNLRGYNTPRERL